MSDPLAQLEPRSLWGHFSSICGTPRPSGREQEICDWLKRVAEEKGYRSRSDRAGNLVIDVPASPGHEQAPTVVLQAHVDMVCEKTPDAVHDFERDPIRPQVRGDWVTATGTTLGADNGIGVAAALAAATDPGVTHGPLQLLLTVDEETGLNGAAQLDGSLVTGRILLNLDSEDDGCLFVGCAGGADTHLGLEVDYVAPTVGGRAHQLYVGGLAGGHSGLDIGEDRGNAIKLLTRVLAAALDSGIALELIDLRGGTVSNAIPREAEATFFLPEGTAERFRSVLTSQVKGFRDELGEIDAKLEPRFEPTQHDGRCLARGDRNRLLHLLMVLPNGPQAMSHDIPGLVETSCCLAVVEPSDGRFRIVDSSRSSLESSMDAVLASVRAAGALAGARVKTHDRYPGWKPDMSSPLLGLVRPVFAEIWEREPEVTAVHAGLECGLLGKRVPGLDMISFGPQIEGAHSPEERVNIASVARFWQALSRVLARLADQVPAEPASRHAS